MDMIPRILTKVILARRKPGFVNIIYGPRRVGKTVLLTEITNSVELQDKKVTKFNGDTSETRNALSNTSEVALTKLVEKSDVILIDEAQRIENIGLTLKILIDKFPEKNFFVTGSSSLALARGTYESLTGRALKYKLYPLSTQELTSELQDYQKQSLLPNQLVHGSYPYLLSLSSVEERREYLKSIVEDYLFHDIVLLKDITSPETIRKLATLLAFQIGSEVSLNELSRNLGIDVKTVIRYITLLEKSFVIFELSAFSKNARKEVSKSKKYYFWDLGIRNALINQFMPIDVRSDRGQLWENFLAVERKKRHEYERRDVSHHFWRTYEKREIDWIEQEEVLMRAYEFKWQDKKVKTPKFFREKYKKEVEVISKENYLDFVG